MYEPDPVPNPRFTGIFIPVELLELHDLSYLELILLSWIDALYCPKHKGCYASNAYLAARLQSQPNTIAKAITELRKKDLIEDVSYDGRTRIIRSLIHRLIDKTQSKSELDKNPIPLDKNPRVYGQKSKSHIYESKVEIKDKDIAQTASPPRQDISFSFDSSSFEFITDHDLRSWKELYPSIDINHELKRMTEWCLSNPTKTKSKKLWRKFITNWLSKANEERINKQAYQKGANTSQIELNKEFARKAVESYKSQSCYCKIDNDGITFIPTLGQQLPFTLKFSENGFKEQCKTQFYNRGFS